MATGRKGRHYEMVLEVRHLLGIFFALVLLSALFFTLGFVLGRNQAPSQEAAIPSTEKAPATSAEPTGPAAADLSFYDRVEAKQPPESLPGAAAERKPAKTKRGATTAPPTAAPQSRGSGSVPATAAAPIYLQVAALTQEPEAKRLVRELQQLGFAAVIRPPRTDRFYRVQVGPFENAERAAVAERRLKAQGFREIIKR